MASVYKGDQPFGNRDLLGDTTYQPSRRRRQKTKDSRAPTPTYTIWVCPHVEKCDNRGACASATFLNRPRIGA